MIKLKLSNIRLGMRTTKTGIAILICLIFSYILSYDAPFYACIAAIVSMQDTVDKSLEIGKSRLIGTLIGGLLGILFLWMYMFFQNEIIKIILAAVAVIVSFMVCLAVDNKQACPICGVVVLGILLTHIGDDDVYGYALTRTIETAFGVVVAFLVNRYIWPRAGVDLEKEDDIRVEMKDEIKEEIKDEMMDGFKEEIKDEIKDEMMEELREELKDEILYGLKDGLGSHIPPV